MNDLFGSIRKVLVPIHREGYPFILIAGVLALVIGHWSTAAGWVLGLVTVWICYFFRDPERVTPVAEGIVVSPADGRVSLVADVVPPPELDLPRTPMTRVSIFMNVFDCHVNRAPVAGRIGQIHYTPGLFLNADLDKASEDNERNALVIETRLPASAPGAPGAPGEASGATVLVGVVQIAGLVARRIVDFVHAGDVLAAGQRFGLIRFGSRVDVYLPLGTPVLVGVGQKAVAGETVLADLSRARPAPGAFRTA